MAVKNGTSIAIYVGGTKVAQLTSASVPTSHGTRDITSKDSAGWAEALEGLREWGVEGEGMFDLASAYGYTDLFALIKSRASVTLRWSSETSGEEYHEGDAFLTDLSGDAGVEESATFSFSFSGSGGLNYLALT